MKRFYEDAAVVAGESGFEIRLDGRPVRTPARAPLALPTQGLAEAIAEEWRAQGETVDPRSMPLTGLSNGALAQTATHSGSLEAGNARSAESDQLCYLT